MNIIDEIKESFKVGSILTKLIYINLGVFVTISIVHVFVFFAKADENILIEWLAVPADPEKLLYRPWTLITYMFLHYQFMHILFNMLVLFWFGKIFLSYLDQKKLLSVYILGGLSGALMYILIYNIIPPIEYKGLILYDETNSICLGASASVMAIVLAISFYAPNHRINMLFIGAVKLKYLALGYVFLDIISIASYNAGGHIAHLGGAAFGLLFATLIRKGNDITGKFSKFLDSLFSVFKPKKKMKVTYKKSAQTETDMDYNAKKANEQEVINSILDKIAKSGYDSLTKKEKETLFKASNKK